MAKNTENKKGNKNTAYGTLPADKLVRFKLKNTSHGERVVSRNTKVVKKLSRAVKSYRQYVHNVNEARLPSSLRNTVHYFSIPLTRADSDNPRDRKGLEVDASVEGSAE